VLSSGLGGALGFVGGRYIPKLTEKLGRKKALMKQEALDQAQAAMPVQVRETSAVLETMAPQSKAPSLAAQAQRELEVGGTIDIRCCWFSYGYKSRTRSN
jgi:hypothetical protein